MIQIQPAQCRLQRKYHGLAGLGYRVLNLDGTLYSPFTQRGVVEVMPGCYTVLGGVSAPVDGGMIVWGEGDRDILPWPIDPMPPVTPDNSAQIQGLQQAMTELIKREPAKVDKLVSALDKPTLARIGAMLKEAFRELDNKRFSESSELFTEEMRRFRLAIGERFNASADAIEAHESIVRLQAEQNAGVLTSFGELIDQLRATATDIAARPIAPTDELQRLRMALSEFVGAFSAAEQADSAEDEPVEHPEIALALTEFFEAAEAGPDAQTYSEDESAAIVEAAARVIARGDE